MGPVAVIELLASGAGVISFAGTLAGRAWTRWRPKQQQAVETAIAGAVAKIAVEHLLGPSENMSDASEAAVWLDGKLAPLFELMRDRGLAGRLLAAAETMSGPAIASWERSATTALDGWPDRGVVDEIFDTEGLLEQLPREITEALLRLALPGGPLEERWPDLAGAAERLGALLANGQEMPPATPAERATYLWAHLAQVAADVDDVPAVWGPYVAFDFTAVDQPATVRTMPTTRDTDAEVEADAYAPSLAHASRTDAAVALTQPEHRLTVVIGEPGYGKSWLLRRTAARITADAQALAEDHGGHAVSAAHVDAAIVPVWVRLDGLAGVLAKPADRTFAAALVDTLTTERSYQASPGYHRWLINRIDAGHCVLLLDGLDEVPAAAVGELQRALTSWITTVERQGATKPQVVVTSRPIPDAEHIVDRADCRFLELLPFTDADVTRFIDAALPEDGTTARLRRAMGASPAMAGMARIPMLLTLLCRLATDPKNPLPKRRTDLYEQVIDQLVHAKHRSDDDRAINLDAATHWELLQRVAITMTTMDSGWVETIGRSDLWDAIEQHPRKGCTTAEARDRLTAPGRGVLIASGGGLHHDETTTYRFLHRTFHEYLVARALPKNPQCNEYVEAHRWFDDDWRQVLIMLAGQPGTDRFDPERYLDSLATPRCDPLNHGLFLAATASAAYPDAERSAIVDAIIGKVAERTHSAVYAFAIDAIDALQPLGAVGHQAAIDHLIHLTRADSELQMPAMRVLADISDPRVVAEQLKLLRDQDMHVRDAAAWALQGATDPEVVAELLALLRDDDPGVRTTAAWALQGATDPEVVAELLALLRDDDPDVRTTAAWALRGSSAPGVVAELLTLLRDDDPGVRTAAVEALQGATDPEVVAELLALLRDDHPGVRTTAAWALRGSSAPGVVAELVALLRDDDPDVRIAAVEALHGVSDARAVAGLLRLAHDDDPDVRIAAVDALHGVPDPRAVAGLLRLAHDDDPDVRIAAVDALHGASDPRAVAGLLQLLRDNDPGLRRAAASALVDTSDPEAVPRLLQLLQDDDPTVQTVIASALADIADPEVVAELLTLTYDDGPEMPRPPASRSGVTGVHGMTDRGWMGEDAPAASTILGRLISGLPISVAAEALKALTPAAVRTYPGSEELRCTIAGLNGRLELVSQVWRDRDIEP